MNPLAGSLWIFPEAVTTSSPFCTVQALVLPVKKESQAP
jgi:hypothetical protein